MDESFYSRMRGDMSQLRERFENRYDILEHVLGIDRMGKQLHCLDLGCGSGEWLDVLKDNGHVVFGIDHDKRMTALCRKKGYEALSGDFFDALGSIDDHSFDLVSLFHVVEHLGINDICRLLDEFHRICRTGFHLLIEVPNIHNPFLSTANFFLDPTHRTKLPLELLDHLMDVFHYDLEHARFIERNPVHAQLYRGGQSLSAKRDERYDHMELLLIGTARAQD
jgi:SAM-dependent methyltransferase